MNLHHSHAPSSPAASPSSGQASTVSSHRLSPLSTSNSTASSFSIEHVHHVRRKTSQWHSISRDPLGDHGGPYKSTVHRDTFHQGSVLPADSFSQSNLIRNEVTFATPIFGIHLCGMRVRVTSVHDAAAGTRFLILHQELITRRKPTTNQKKKLIVEEYT